MQQFESFYTTNAFADDNTRRYPSVPSDTAFVPGKTVSYLTANAADSVFRTVFEATGKITGVGTDAARPFIDLLNGRGAVLDGTHQGKNPIGIATPNSGAGHEQFAFVANDISRNVSVLDLQTQDIAGNAADDSGAGMSVFPSTAPPTAGTPEGKILVGRRLFNTGAARWSRNGQAWQACQSCHMDGLSDNITWKFGRGPRQSVSLDGTFSKTDPTNQRIFNWTGIFDEVADFEGNVRGISGGKGAITDDTETPVAPNAQLRPRRLVPRAERSRESAGASDRGLSSGLAADHGLRAADPVAEAPDKPRRRCGRRRQSGVHHRTLPGLPRR